MHCSRLYHLIMLCCALEHGVYSHLGIHSVKRMLGMDVWVVMSTMFWRHLNASVGPKDWSRSAWRCAKCFQLKYPCCLIVCLEVDACQFIDFW